MFFVSVGGISDGFAGFAEDSKVRFEQKESLVHGAWGKGFVYAGAERNYKHLDLSIIILHFNYNDCITRFKHLVQGRTRPPSFDKTLFFAPAAESSFGGRSLKLGPFRGAGGPKA